MIGTDGLPVLLDLELFSSGRRFVVRIDFPDNYPPTPLRQENEQLGELVAMIDSNNDELYISSFAVNTSRHLSRLATREERRMTRGLGKQMLCLLANHLVDQGLADENTGVMLEASGGKCFEEDLEDFTMSEREMDRILARFPMNVNDEYEVKRDLGLRPELTLQEKKEWVCAHLENQMLVEYFQRYGLQPEEDPQDMFYTVMRGTIGQILDRCE